MCVCTYLHLVNEHIRLIVVTCVAVMCSMHVVMKHTLNIATLMIIDVSVLSFIVIYSTVQSLYLHQLLHHSAQYYHQLY